ncbi:ice-binding family protein [Winogradskyella sp. UBA3174]|uniref:ice-binding family protein n=1 Tax=Winogradskyella sp. UBA3174 TaxID=1947785 RepID=UPI0025F53C86|nr:ice-binding family protein [Winogradskyella sp. UBA3174]|tara:strand:- start:83657 stop:86893 length:3237 start_codon:yes stop_codon:yes gene_type:complete
MKKILLLIVVISHSFSVIAQSGTPLIDFDFGSAADFILFTGAGAVANTGTSAITGDVGSHAGAIAGFGSPTVLNGTIENANSITVNATIDLAAVCVQIQNVTANITDHSAIYGSVAGETIYPGVYSSLTAVAITGTLILDAQGDPNAQFIFKITGALNSVAGATVVLTNGASSDNVFWIAVGAVALGANTTMVGTAIAYPGAVSLGAGGAFDGRFYSTIGAIAIDTSVGAIPLGSPFYDSPFNCDLNAYLFQDNDIYTIDLASGSSYQLAADVTPGNINAAAYNPVDGFIWGSLSTPEKTIVRIGENFRTRTYYVDELPTTVRDVGDVSSNGIYYLKGDGTTYYKIDLNPESVNYTQHQATETLSIDISIDDWAFNAVDGYIYTVEKNTNILYRIDPSNGNVLALGEVPILTGSTYTYGAVYFDLSGRFYVSANQTGTIYVIQSVQTIDTVEDIDSNLFAFGPSSSSNDGARCPTAPVLQEICDNGIDDDGDGLIDCEDPSCSGFGICDVIASPTSSSNSGGLESNSRLSEQINARNFKRAKAGYTFDAATSPRIERGLMYASKSSNSSFILQDFVPLTTINEDEAVEATPSDLIGITNATDIYAVDYLKNNSAVASVLVLKTENGVYEHTKYICDRLLGAELISVSTIDISEQQFIKSIIKNEDGTFEFVLSLSAKVVNNDANFAIESHWNIDQYEENVTFYNFQIWSNTIDDLYVLGQEVLNLLNIEKPISSYNNSTPPSVFVRKGKYIDGGLDLQIINTNGTQSVALDAGFRATETEDFNNLNSTINLNGQYITNLTVETGNLFDIGFRIGDGIATPDDLFMSDGPWGIDDSQTETNVSLYNVTTNDFEFDTNDFAIERNVDLNATTSTYVAAYRALTPRFKAVDLAEYNSFKFSAEGNGNLEITFVKQSITDWEAQFKTTVTLTSIMQDFTINIDDLQNSFGDDAELDDVITLVFTMVSEDGTMISKLMSLNNLRFSQTTTLSVSEFINDAIVVKAFPNPMTTYITLQFTASQSETVQIVMYDQLGKQVYNKSYNAVLGKNSITLNRENLSTGLYFCKIVSCEYNFNPLKLIIN